jgi:AraC family transcriptional regulator of adaptative response/methylated-DNA-[protein]-cysteine methyltransferase
LSLNAPRKTSSDKRWAAVLARDKSADGAFYYADATTGVYCRPGCASRTPHRHNVAFYDDAEAAESAEYRPCKRCKPDQPAR